MKSEYIKERMQQMENLANIIGFGTRVIQKIKDNPELFCAYDVEMQKVIIEYNTEVELLKQALEEYFTFEKEKGLPASLSLRRAYEELQFL